MRRRCTVEKARPRQIIMTVSRLANVRPSGRQHRSDGCCHGRAEGHMMRLVLLAWMVIDCASDSLSRKTQPERCAHVRLAVDAALPFMVLHDRSHDRKAESRAGRRIVSRWINPVEALKDALPVLFANPRSCIGHRYRGCPIGLRAFKGDLRATWCM